MKKLRLAASIMLAVTLSWLPLTAAAKDEPVRKGSEAKGMKNETQYVAAAAKVLKDITALPKRKIPPELFSQASAVIVVPNAPKNAFMVSGGSVKGMLLVRDASGTWSNPVFLTLSGGTLGWQIVGDPMDILLLFRNNKTVNTLLKGKVSLDVKVSIVPGRVAPTMKGASNQELEAEITSYVRSHGEFAEDGVVAGATLQIDAAANDAYYARTKVDAADVIAGKVTRSSDDLAAIHKALSSYATVK